jgi:hypothetical protein
MTLNIRTKHSLHRNIRFLSRGQPWLQLQTTVILKKELSAVWAIGMYQKVAVFRSQSWRLRLKWVHVLVLNSFETKLTVQGDRFGMHRITTNVVDKNGQRFRKGRDHELLHKKSTGLRSRNLLRAAVNNGGYLLELLSDRKVGRDATKVITERQEVNLLCHSHQAAFDCYSDSLCPARNS